MRSLLVVCLLVSTASAEDKAGDWTHYEVERALSSDVFRSPAVAIYVSGLQGRQWFVGDHVFEQRWDMDRLYPLLNDLAKAKTTTSQAMTCKHARTAPCTKRTYTGEWTSFGSTSKVVVVVTLAPQVRGTGIADLEVTIDGKLSWRMTAIGYGNGATATWGRLPWRTSVQVPSTLEIPRPHSIVGVGRPPDLGEHFAHLAPDTGPLIGLTAVGDLDKAIIRRYLKRNLGKLTFCYEKEQLTKPTLEGAVDLTFQIAPDGKVTSSTARGLDREVERCAADVVKRIEFPKPKTNARVDVSFTLRFRIPKPSAGNPR